MAISAVVASWGTEANEESVGLKHGLNQSVPPAWRRLLKQSWDFSSLSPKPERPQTVHRWRDPAPKGFLAPAGLWHAPLPPAPQFGRTDPNCTAYLFSLPLGPGTACSGFQQKATTRKGGRAQRNDASWDTYAQTTEFTCFAAFLTTTNGRFYNNLAPTQAMRRWTLPAPSKRLSG